MTINPKGDYTEIFIFLICRLFSILRSYDDMILNQMQTERRSVVGAESVCSCERPSGDCFNDRANVFSVVHCTTYLVVFYLSL